MSKPVKPAPARPYLSGFCNPTLPKTVDYDPHTRCSTVGCCCPCHRPPDVPDGWMLHPGYTRTSSEVEERQEAAPDPLAELTVGQAADLVYAAAQRLSAAAMADTVAALDWTDAVKVLDTLHAARVLLDDVRDGLTRHVYLHGEHGHRIIDGIGQVTVGRRREGEKWDERGAIAAYVDQKLADAAGEFTPEGLVDWVLEVAGISYCRKTALRTVGLPVEAFYESTPGSPYVQLPGGDPFRTRR